MDAQAMRERTKQYALRIIRVVRSLPRNRECNVIGPQLLRAGTSTGANYRAVCRARSRADFIAKLGIVEEECDESLFRMEILVESGIIKGRLLRPLVNEGSQILAIVVSSKKTARGRGESS